ncbi:EAL domain-containing protein [Vibrio sp. ZSDE26]|uniref:cyclic-guanylate-specific phosphodiesterase n=1 Tax=Vibrio amylolyticus TaxID=2847292 RepID=A0A9X2BIX6_9VIBR|nr:EAL domain-containing protein [Vibrio amylolyticus]MCK6265144.1 EAL domain-containing protein [Vibrio amylolyticus]
MTQHHSSLAIPNPFKSLPLIILLPFVLISSTFTIVTMNSIQNEMHENAAAYLELIEQTVSNLEADNLAAITTPIDCVKMQENLMFENTSRELIVVKDDIAICSSKRGIIKIDLSSFIPPEGSNDGAYLFDINNDPSQRTLFVVNSVTGDKHSGIFSITNTAHLLEQYTTVANSQSSTVTLKFGNKIYPYDSDFISNRTHAFSHSNNYNFSVLVETQPAYVTNNIIVSFLRSLAISILSSYIIFLSVRRFQRRSTLVDDLRRGLTRQEFFLCYQPLINSEDETIGGIEALIRWNHPKLGLIRPDLFIPLAEQQNLINQLTDYVINAALNDLSQIPSSTHIHLGINVPPNYLHQQNCIDVLDTYREGFLAVGYILTIEVTERQMLDETGRETIKRLRTKGVKISIDDFGTGHTSLSVLQTINFDYLKIDKCFIDNIGVESVSAPVLNTIIDLGHRLGVTIVAEGVETEHQVNYLVDKNVSVLQGYYYYKPLPLAKLKRLMLSNQNLV